MYPAERRKSLEELQELEHQAEELPKLLVWSIERMARLKSRLGELDHDVIKGIPPKFAQRLASANQGNGSLPVSLAASMPPPANVHLPARQASSNSCMFFTANRYVQEAGPKSKKAMMVLQNAHKPECSPATGGSDHQRQNFAANPALGQANATTPGLPFGLSDLYHREIPIIEANKMLRSAQLVKRQTKAENEAQREPTAKKSRSNYNTSNIATLDNGTMVEALKYLNYSQLAKNSLVSKRFFGVIQTHRHKLAILCVHSVYMNSFDTTPAVIKIFDKELSPEAYNEWVVRNSYLKQAPLDDQVACKQSPRNLPNSYLLSAFVQYKDPNNREMQDPTNVFFAHVELNDENWPVFQHFIRLVTDPFINIDYMKLTPQNDVLDLLARAINPDRGQLQCKILTFGSNTQKSITWPKDHVRCNIFCIDGNADLNQDEVLLDFIMTGARCTPAIEVESYDLYRIIVDLVQRFLDLEKREEYQGVQSIKGFHFVQDLDIQIMKNEYSKFIVNEEHDEEYDSSTYVFEFSNNAIGKKLQLTIYDNCHDSVTPTYSLYIKNL